MPTTQPGTYFILRPQRCRPTGAPIQLLAKLLPFEITNVTPDAGGASQFVTLDILGAQFDPQAVVKLVRPQIDEFEPVSYQVVNSTEILATFDLSSAAQGLYDVEVINPDGSEAVDPYRYLVEPAQPLNVSIGIGGPTQLDPGQIGIYRFVIASNTNVDAPYVHFEIGLPDLGPSQRTRALAPAKSSFSIPTWAAPPTSPACLSTRSTRSSTWAASTRRPGSPSTLPIKAPSACRSRRMSSPASARRRPRTRTSWQSKTLSTCSTCISISISRRRPRR